MRGGLLISCVGLLAGPACVGCDAGYLGAAAPLEIQRGVEILRVVNGKSVPVRGDIDLGTAHPGDVIRAHLRLVNHGSQPLEITGVETSCDCLRCELIAATSIAAGKSTDFEVVLDLSEDEGFVGGLAPIVSVKRMDGQPYRIVFLIDIAARPLEKLTQPAAVQTVTASKSIVANLPLFSVP